MSLTLEETHEILISEYELLERELTRLANQNRDLRSELRKARAEIAELQDILEKAWVKA